MSLKRIVDEESGFVHTLEAIIGIFLIIGTVIFVTSGMPHMSQKTGEHSKIQLVDIGRDVLDLIVVTPRYETCSNCLDGEVYRNYTLIADKKFVAPGENVTFTVYDNGANEIIYKSLTLTRSTLGLKNDVNIGTINGTVPKQFLSSGEFNIRAVEGDMYDPTTWSNYVTINVGYYFLDTNISGISSNGSRSVYGIVYNSTGFGIPGLNIEILDSDGTLVSSPPANPIGMTSYGKIIERFENVDGWISDRNITLNNIVITEGMNSLSLNGNSESFWIEKINNTPYGLNYYDIVSFDFFKIAINETINVELLSSTVPGKFIWKNIGVNNPGWNKINVKLYNPTTNVESLCCHPNYPKIEGSINVADIDTIRITVSNASAGSYLIDNLVSGNGNFSFDWIGKYVEQPGSYYIQASDGVNTSNKHRVIFSNKGLLLNDDDFIYEGQTTKIRLVPQPSGDPQDLDRVDRLKVNLNYYKPACFDMDKITMVTDGSDPTRKTVNFTGNTAGDYYIFYGETAGGCSSGGGPPNGDPAAGAKTNSIIIHVLPLSNRGPTGDNICVDKKKLNEYVIKYMPQYINYNLYLIDSKGYRFTKCTKFEDGELINGYPTEDAITVNKLVRIKYKDFNDILEFRIVMWYK